MSHPPDNEKPKEHPPPPHQHLWVPTLNDWKEITGYVCSGCGASKSA